MVGVLDSREFRRILGHYPTGVCAVTSVNASGPMGMIVGSFTSVSLDPPLVAFARPRLGDLAQDSGRGPVLRQRAVRGATGYMQGAVVKSGEQVPIGRLSLFRLRTADYKRGGGVDRLRTSCDPRGRRSRHRDRPGARPRCRASRSTARIRSGWVWQHLALCDGDAGPGRRVG